MFYYHKLIDSITATVQILRRVFNVPDRLINRVPPLHKKKTSFHRNIKFNIILSQMSQLFLFNRCTKIYK